MAKEQTVQSSDPVIDASTRPPGAPVPTLVPLFALEGFEVMAGQAADITCREEIALEAGTVAIVFPDVLRLAGPQAAAVVAASGIVSLPVYNMNPTRRLTGAAGERVGSLIVVRLA